mgnify:CR=1 FL=1
MKTRAQIYSHEASGILREISTYGVLTQKQILGLYPQKDEQLKNLLSYLCKQKRLFLVDGFYSLTPELPKDRDRGLEAAVTVLADFMEQVEYHAAGEYPVKIIFLAGGEVYEILYAEPGKEAILNPPTSASQSAGITGVSHRACHFEPATCSSGAGTTRAAGHSGRRCAG